MRLAIVVALLAGCGRIAFDPIETNPRFTAPAVLIYGGINFEADDNFESQLATFASSVHRDPESIVLDANVLAGFDLVIVESLGSTHSAAESNALADWIAAGGSLAVVSAYFPGDLTSYNPLLQGVGVQLAGPIFDGPITDFAVHPITDGLASIPFRGGYAVEADGTYTTIAKHGTMPVGVVASHGTGRVLVWGDEWVIIDNLWIGTDDPAFWENALAWLRHKS